MRIVLAPISSCTDCPFLGGVPGLTFVCGKTGAALAPMDDKGRIRIPVGCPLLEAKE